MVAPVIFRSYTAPLPRSGERALAYRALADGPEAGSGRIMSADVQELLDRLELRQVVEAYAHGADRRDAEGMAALFTENGRLAIYDGQPGTAEPTSERRGRSNIASAMTGLNRYEVTTHLLGQQSVHIDGDRATGETYCLAHHLSHRDGTRENRVMSIRYLDTYVRTDGRWLIDERVLAVDWIETRKVDYRA
jgi:uncharacterized protein (TIGR02246 family)